MRTLISNARLHAVSLALRARLHPTGRDDLVRIGSDYGGWWIPESLAAPGTVAYCAGAGEDITFDLGLHERGCHVTTFDPTPRAISHVESNAPSGNGFRFVPVGWWNEDTVLRFYAPRDPSHISHSAVNLQGTDDYFSAPVKPVRQLMAELGDEHVDIIKMDIEGAEYAVIGRLVQEGPLPQALCVEFDQPQPPRRTVAAVEKLRGAGYDLAHIDFFNYTFVRDEFGARRT
jgi:FkbM family methyltransferase